MKIKKIFFILMLVNFSNCVDTLEKFSYIKSRDRLIKSINTEYSGIVIEKFSPRKNMESTHFALNTGDTICPTNSIVMEILNIGDSIRKDSGDNYISIYSKEGELKKTWLMKIPSKYREDDRFPVQWKGKWMEASE